MNDMSNELKLWYNGNDIVIAVDADDAAKVYEETTGEDWSYYVDHCGEGWQESTKNELVIFFEDADDLGKNVPPTATQIYDGRHSFKYKATAKEWIEHCGRGWLCSENW